jgi:hypothetical protein
MRVNSACQPQWPQPVNITDTIGVNPELFGIVSNPDGHAIVTWTNGEQDNIHTDIKTTKVSASGTILWQHSVCNAQNNQKNPVIAADGLGGAYVAWEDNRYPYRALDVWAQYIHSDGQDAWPLNGIPVAADSFDQKNIRAITDRSRNLILAWEDFRNATDNDLYATKVTPTGQILWQTPDGQNIVMAQGTQEDVDMFAEWHNGIYFAWTDWRNFYPDVYGFHWDSTGIQASEYWVPNNGGLISGAIQWQWLPKLADDGHGGVMCAWADHRASGKQPLKEVWANWVNDGSVPPDLVRLRNVPVPGKTELSQNYPNPFNPNTLINFSIPQNTRVQLEIFNELGQTVEVLVDQVLTAGKYRVNYNATKLASGVYFYRLKTASFMDVKKMMLLK